MSQTYTNVCADQATYNAAFKKAVIDYEKNQCSSKGCKTSLMIVGLIMLAFYVWAFLLAIQVKDKEHRVLHIVFALTTGPIYILAHYSSFSGKNRIK